jgi:tellurite resistance protein TerC
MHLERAMGEHDWTSLRRGSLIRRIAVGVVGFSVLMIGVAMLVLPGPAVIVIPLGLAILATEFVWARTLLNKARAKLSGPKDETHQHQAQN